MADDIRFVEGPMGDMGEGGGGGALCHSAHLALAVQELAPLLRAGLVDVLLLDALELENERYAGHDARAARQDVVALVGRVVGWSVGRVGRVGWVSWVGGGREWWVECERA